MIGWWWWRILVAPHAQKMWPAKHVGSARIRNDAVPRSRAQVKRHHNILISSPSKTTDNYHFEKYLRFFLESLTLPYNMAMQDLTSTFHDLVNEQKKKVSPPKRRKLNRERTHVPGEGTTPFMPAYMTEAYSIVRLRNCSYCAV